MNQDKAREEIARILSRYRTYTIDEVEGALENDLLSIIEEREDKQPENCPKCESDDVEFLKDWDEPDGSHVQDFRCLDCNAEWDVYFRFERWEMKPEEYWDKNQPEY